MTPSGLAAVLTPLRLGETTHISFDATATLIRLAADPTDAGAFTRAKYAVQSSVDAWVLQGNSGTVVTSTTGMSLPTTYRWTIDIDDDTDNYLSIMGQATSGTLRLTLISCLDCVTPVRITPVASGDAYTVYVWGGSTVFRDTEFSTGDLLTTREVLQNGAWVQSNMFASAYGEGVVHPATVHIPADVSNSGAAEIHVYGGFDSDSGSTFSSSRAANIVSNATLASGGPGNTRAATVLLNGSNQPATGPGVFVVNRTGASDILYDLSANTWLEGASPPVTRDQNVGARLASGKLLVAGGTDLSDVTLASAHIYTPSTNAWAATGSLSTARQQHVLIALDGDDKVIAIGGWDGSSTLASCELYDESAGTWAAAASMNTPRRSFDAIKLPDGKILVAGGYTTGGSAVASCEVYDPTGNTWSYTGSLPATRVRPTTGAGSQGNGTHMTLYQASPVKVIYVGGGNGTDGTPASTATYIWTQSAGTWETGPTLNTARYGGGVGSIAP